MNKTCKVNWCEEPLKALFRSPELFGISRDENLSYNFLGDYVCVSGPTVNVSDLKYEASKKMTIFVQTASLTEDIKKSFPACTFRATKKGVTAITAMRANLYKLIHTTKIEYSLSTTPISA